MDQTNMKEVFPTKSIEETALSTENLPQEGIILNGGQQFENNVEDYSPINYKLGAKQCESMRLRIPIINLYFNRRDMSNLPFEARLLPFSCRLPKQMTRGPQILGEGNILRRIDEDFAHELPYKEGENEDSSFVTNELIVKADSDDKALPEKMEDLRIDDSEVLAPKLNIPETIYEATAMDERIFHFPLAKSQRKLIPEDKEWLEGIAEVRRKYEMAEERPDEEDEVMDARIWESDSTPVYCRKAYLVCSS